MYTTYANIDAHWYSLPGIASLGGITSAGPETMTSNSLLLCPIVWMIKEAAFPTLVWYSPFPLAVTSLPKAEIWNACFCLEDT